MQLTIPIPESHNAVRLPPGIVDGGDEEFFLFCQVNRGLRIERSAEGQIVVMSPAGGYQFLECQSREQAGRLGDERWKRHSLRFECGVSSLERSDAVA
jgi:hypothetical protein